MRRTPDERFLAKVGKPDRRGCRRWLGFCDKHGYGRFSFQGRLVGAHCFAFYRVHGRLPRPIGRHTCDHPWCVTETHVIEGTYADNTADARARGRLPTGDRSGARKHPETRPRGQAHSQRMQRYWAAHPEKLARGSRNGKHTHPELRPRGQQHWVHRHPEWRRYGLEVGNSKFSDSIVRQVRRAKGTHAAVARRFGMTTVWASKIRRGLVRTKLKGDRR